jgi:hypothetical protein
MARIARALNRFAIGIWTLEVSPPANSSDIRRPEKYAWMWVQNARSLSPSYTTKMTGYASASHSLKSRRLTLQAMVRSSASRGRESVVLTWM